MTTDWERMSLRNTKNFLEALVTDAEKMKTSYIKAGARMCLRHFPLSVEIDEWEKKLGANG